MTTDLDAERARDRWDFLKSEERITDPDTGGQKGQKLERYDLVPAEGTDEVARVYGWGCTKKDPPYEDHNWRKGYPWSLSIAALERHVSQFKQGNNLDPESRLHHLAHAAFHCLALITFYKNGLGTDDRAR